MFQLNSIREFEEQASDMLRKSDWCYFKSGATEEITLRDNTSAFQRYNLRPRLLTDVSKVDLSTTVLGYKIDFPVCIAPTAVNKIADPMGEIAVAKAAAIMNIGYVLGAWSTSSIEDVAEATRGAINWMQIHIYKDRSVTKDLVKRAEKNGFGAIFVTVDAPVLGHRYQVKGNGLFIPPFLSLPNIGSSQAQVQGHQNFEEHVCKLLDPSLTWSDIAWLKSVTKLPLVLKGILTAEMAEKAVKCGIEGILVSNHGARQLDGVPATIDALQQVVKAVDGKVEVYMDGGISSGTDVLKAVALGAKTVFVGRLPIWGLACNSEDGVRSVLTFLRNEFQDAMQLIGCRSVKELQEGSDFVKPVPINHVSHNFYDPGPLGVADHYSETN